MSRDSIRRVEEMLRNGASSARRDPSPEVRARIASALRARVDPGLESSTAADELARARSSGHELVRTGGRELTSTGGRELTSSTGRASLARPAARRAWRGRVQDVLVAASVVAAIGVWGFAFLRDSPSSLQPTAAETSARSGTQLPGEVEPFSIESSVPSQAITLLARATPRSLRTAIDGSLLGELGNIAHDATEAVHFLVGRVPAPLVTRATEDALH